MTSCYIITERATSARVSVMRLTSRSQQLPFADANDGTGPAHYNHVTGERN